MVIEAVAATRAECGAPNGRELRPHSLEGNRRPQVGKKIFRLGRFIFRGKISVPVHIVR